MPRDFSSLIILLLHLLLAPLSTSPLHSIRPLPHINIPRAHRLAPGTLLPLAALPAINGIRTAIMPAHAALAVITPYPHRHNLPAALAVADPDRGVLVVGRVVVVRLLEVRVQLHQRARRERVVVCARQVQEVVCDERVQDRVGFGNAEARVGRLRFRLCVGRAGLALAAPPRACELRGVHVLYGHGFACRRVVGVEHGVEEPPDVGDFAGGEARGELGEGVGGFIYEGVGGFFGGLVARVADFEAVGLESGVDGLDDGCYEALLGHVALGEGTIGVFVHV